MSENAGATQPKTLEEAIQEIEDLRGQLSGSDLKVFTQNKELKVQNSDLKEQIQQLTEQCVSQTFSVRGLEKSQEKLQATVAQLESDKAALEGQVSDLKSKISDLETHVTDLGGQLEEHKSKELNLSQELEKTIAQNSEALQKLQAETEEAARKKAEELEQTRAKFEAEVSAKQEAIKALEDRVEKFKEEFLSQEIAPVAASANGSAGSGQAFEILSSKMETFLGFPGRAMVEQVFRLSGVDQSTSDIGELEETFEVLQDTAAQLVRSPEQEAELAQLLKDAWAEIGMGAGEAPVSGPKPTSAEEAPPSVEPEAKVGSQETPEAEEVAEVVTEPSEESDQPEETVETAEAVTNIEEEEAPVEEAAEVQEEETPAETSGEVAEESSESAQEPESVEQAEIPLETESATEPGPESESEAPQEETAVPEVELATPELEPAIPEPVAEAAETVSEPAEESEEVAQTEPTPVEDESSPQTEEASEPSAETPAAPEATEVAEVVEESAEPEPTVVEETAPEEVAPVESSSPEEAPAPEQASPSEEASADAPLDFEKAAALLEDGSHEEALPIFEALHQADSSELTYQVGRVACLANIGRFKEAYDIGKSLTGAELGDSQEIYDESMDMALMGVASEAESDLVRKEYILELLQRTKSPEHMMTYLDEADEIAMRLSNEGELSLLQAKHRIGQDDVTEYLIDALHSLSDRTETFALLRANLERYPELTPLSAFLERLLDSSRAESLEAESEVKELLGQGESIEDLLDETDPGEEAVVQVFLEHLLPRSEVKVDIPSEEFEELMLEAEPAAFVGSLRQALRSVDYTVFFDEIEVLSYDGDDHFLLRSSPEPTPTLLFGAELDDVPPEELRFLVLRELFSMYRRHSQLAHISANLDDEKRVKLVRACIDIFSEFEAKVPPETLETLANIAAAAKEGGQDQEFRSNIETFLREVYIKTESDSFLELGDFLYGGQLNRKWLDSISDGFGAKQTGIVVASYAICRDLLSEEDFEQLEEEGFGWLYNENNKQKFSELRLRLQRLWTTPLKALISEPEE